MKALSLTLLLFLTTCRPVPDNLTSVPGPYASVQRFCDGPNLVYVTGMNSIAVVADQCIFREGTWIRKPTQ